MIACAQILSIGRLEMARTNTAQKQKRKTKAKAPKVVRRRAMAAARIDVPDTKQRAVDARPSDRMEKATVTEAGRTDPPRDTARSNEHHPAGVMNPPSSAPIAERQSNQQTQHRPSRAI